MRKLDFNKVEFSENHPTVADALQDVEPLFTSEEAKQLCEELGIIWEENATEATLHGNPVMPADISRAFNKVQFDKE